MSRTTTPERYDYHSLLHGTGRGQAGRVLFTVTCGGRVRDEILSVSAIEVRIRIWEDALRQDPHLSWRDPNGQHNYREYVHALVECVKMFSI